MVKMIRQSSAIALAIFACIAGLAMGLLIQKAFDKSLVQANECVTAFLRLPADQTRSEVPESEVRRVCGSNPHFNLEEP